MSHKAAVHMDSTQVLCKNDAFVFEFEYKQYRARVTHTARERSLNVSLGDSHGPEQWVNGETDAGNERFMFNYSKFIKYHDMSFYRIRRPMLNNAFLSLSTVRFEMNTIPQLVSKVFFIEFK